MQNAATLARPAVLSLSQWLLIDALTCVVTGAAFVISSGWLGHQLELPPALLFYAGALLFPCAGLMLLAAKTQARPLVWLVISGNAAWSAASVIVAFALEPSALGWFVVLAQAGAVAILGFMEWRLMEWRALR
jgi:hypothetical protein